MSELVGKESHELETYLLPRLIIFHKRFKIVSINFKVIANPSPVLPVPCGVALDLITKSSKEAIPITSHISDTKT